MLKLRKSLSVKFGRLCSKYPVILVIYFLAIGFFLILDVVKIYDFFSENYLSNPAKNTIQSNPAGQREVFLKIVFDKSLASSTIDNWQKIIETAVANTSQIFSSEFKISFIFPENIEIIEMKKPQFSLWEPSSSYLFESTYYLFHREINYDLFLLKRYSKSLSYDIIVGFTNKDYGMAGGRASNIPSRYVIVSGAEALRFSSRQLKINHFTNLLNHELGHCFGAEHIYDKEILYVMNPKWESDINPYLFLFHQKTRETILGNKWIDFKKLK